MIPRMTSVLSSTANPTILTYITQILERAMLDPSYTFPSHQISTPSLSMGMGMPGMGTSESMTSLHNLPTSTSHTPVGSLSHGQHQKRYSASIVSGPGASTVLGAAAAAGGGGGGGGAGSTVTANSQPGGLTGRTEVVLEEMGMKGLANMTFNVAKSDR